ncbi:MAG: polymerase subunit sigma-70, partial [Paenibacillus sp.]|nr:polymerase subunit sigma-70 [Paenibacillus sp.]
MKLSDAEKDTLAEKNWRYIHYFAKKYYSPQWNYEDLVGAATLGMTKAINSFDERNGAKFSTYSARCITNEIFMFMRREKKHLSAISIEQPIGYDEKGNDYTIIDTLQSEEKEMDWREISPIVNKVLGNSPRRTQKIMRLFFENQTHAEIGKRLGLSQSYISRIIKRELQEIKREYWKGEKYVATITLEQYKKLKDEGLSDKQVAESVGVAAPTLSYYKKQWFPATKKTVVAKDSKETDKSVEYESLIAKLKEQLTVKDETIGNQAQTIEDYRLKIADLKESSEKEQHLHAACDDIENELIQVRKDMDKLQSKYALVTNKQIQTDYLVENQKNRIEKVE